MNRPPHWPRALPVLLALLLWSGLGHPAQAWQQTTPQDPEDDVLTKILTEDKQLDKLEKLKKDRARPPFEFPRTQIMPNDVIPFIKANHWAMLGMEIRANHNDYDGQVQTRPVRLMDQPNEVSFHRDARLTKGQQTRLTMPILLPIIPKELGLQLVRPEAIRQDEDWTAALKVLEPQQQLIVVLANEANDTYGRWTSLRSTIPIELTKEDPNLVDQYRYYRMVLPLDPDKPFLSPHPLTWTPISHVIWDAMPPERLGIAQQQAMLDWLHWGGQLVVVGGAGPAFAALRESFLAPYLPADPSGENVSRSGEQLKTLSEEYLPQALLVDSDGDPVMSLPAAEWAEVWNRLGRRYKPPVAIRTEPKKPIFVSGLTPKPGATTIPLGGPGDPPLAVEWRVGRGRVTMLAVALTDPDLAKWEGYDTLLRRVVLRRPEEPLIQTVQAKVNGGFDPAHFEMLGARDLTDVRYLARNLGVAPLKVNKADEPQGYTVNGFAPGNRLQTPTNDWLDAGALPILARETLDKASGIEIPSPGFVLKVILAYLIAVVPLNWLICRYLIGRREWAWAVVPVLSIAFAVGVERAAAYDVGFDSSCDEIDLIETHENYARGHLSRFASIYSTGRVRFTISYPTDASAVALPLATGRSLRGEDAVQSVLRTQPTPALTDFLVQPRSLSMFRAEQMPSLPGTVCFAPSDNPSGPRTVVNNLGFDLADAWVVQVGRSVEEARSQHVGAIAAGASVPLGDLDEFKLGSSPVKPNTLDPGPFQDLLLRSSVTEPNEEPGEIRLVARIDKLMPGQTIDPPVDRHRGFTLVVAHLQPPALANPAGPRYTSAVKGGEKPPPDPRETPVPTNSSPNPTQTGSRR